jgi:HEAT repeat protein
MQNSHQAGLRQLISDYMEHGFLDNIIDMFRHDSALYSLVGELIRDDRVRVRIGVTALLEELKRLDPHKVILAEENLLPLLGHADAVVRGDAANLLGIIGDIASLASLEQLLSDENEDVRLIAREALHEISGRDR